MKKKIQSPEDFLPYERPGESLYEKESRRADAILGKERVARAKTAKLKRAGRRKTSK
jgi:hypothetical protein